jgi:hypothetical protein
MQFAFRGPSFSASFGNEGTDLSATRGEHGNNRLDLTTKQACNNKPHHFQSIAQSTLGTTFGEAPNFLYQLRPPVELATGWYSSASFLLP